jgi:hypothetical protein
VQRSSAACNPVLPISGWVLSTSAKGLCTLKRDPFSDRLSLSTAEHTLARRRCPGDWTQPKTHEPLELARHSRKKWVESTLGAVNAVIITNTGVGG